MRERESESEREKETERGRETEREKERDRDSSHIIFRRLVKVEALRTNYFAMLLSKQPLLATLQKRIKRKRK